MSFEELKRQGEKKSVLSITWHKTLQKYVTKPTGEEQKEEMRIALTLKDGGF